LAGMVMERLEAEICESAAHLAAAECRWLLMVGEFDRRDGAGSWGCVSTAHWLNWRCGLALGAARERVRVARRLAELPLTTAAFSVGVLSYSKVRAITRVATAETEAEFVAVAVAMTAEHVERLVRGYRRATGDGDGEVADAEVVDRRVGLACHWADDGSLVVNARLGPDDGALFLAGVALGVVALGAEGSGAGDWGSPGRWDGWAAAQAAGLVAMAETVLAGGVNPAAGSRRHQVVVHVNAEVLAEEPAAGEDGPTGGRGRCHLEGGPALSADTARRLACDAGLVFMLEGPDGVPVNVSRRSPTVPAALARALKARDGGCRFPGCTHRRFVDAHHIRHRAHGGETTLANLVELCRVHHRLVHEGGYRLEAPTPGRFVFYRPDGTPLDAPTGAVTAGDDALRRINAAHGIHPTPDTPIPSWAGERPDYGYIVDTLLHHVPAGTPPPPPPTTTHILPA
jgi:hypothetical protein